MIKDTDRLRAQVAQEAARIIAEHGIENFRQAKIKAAERLNATRDAALPNNREIEAALKAHHTLFEPDDHSKWIAQLRRTALAAMKLLDAYSPRLVGPVLAGTANEDSAILLHVFADNPDDIYFYLETEGFRTSQGERRYKSRGKSGDRYPFLAFDFGDDLVEATMFPFDGLRQAPTSPVDGKPMARASAAQVEKLLG